MFINFTPKPPQAFLKPIVNLIPPSILVILQNHSFIQFLKEIVSHFLLGLISFGPTTNKKPEKKILCGKVEHSGIRLNIE